MQRRHALTASARKLKASQVLLFHRTKFVGTGCPQTAPPKSINDTVCSAVPQWIQTNKERVKLNRRISFNPKRWPDLTLPGSSILGNARDPTKSDEVKDWDT